MVALGNTFRPCLLACVGAHAGRHERTAACTLLLELARGRLQAVLMLCLRYVVAVWLSELGLCLRGVPRRSRFKNKKKLGKQEEN